MSTTVTLHNLRDGTRSWDITVEAAEPTLEALRAAHETAARLDAEMIERWRIAPKRDALAAIPGAIRDYLADGLPATRSEVARAVPYARVAVFGALNDLIDRGELEAYTQGPRTYVRMP